MFHFCTCLAHIYSMRHIRLASVYIYISPIYIVYSIYNIYIYSIYTQHNLGVEELKQAAVRSWWRQSHHLAELIADVILRMFHAPLGPELLLHRYKMARFVLLPRQDPH